MCSDKIDPYSIGDILTIPMIQKENFHDLIVTRIGSNWMKDKKKFTPCLKLFIISSVFAIRLTCIDSCLDIQ